MNELKNTLAFLGIGNRGGIYAGLVKESGQAEITALCDNDENSLKSVGDALGVPEDKRFSSAEEFFSKGKLADVLVISTPDTVHYEHCAAALLAGYDVALEKPVAVTETQCKEILALAEKLGRKAVVCHVLRYTAFYNKLKELISSGTIGRIVHFSQSENVGWWHYTQSFVRGKWRNDETSSPMILAKCCHDFDIINWLMDDECVSLSSFGELSYFKRENAPANSADYCCECAAGDSCLYNAVARSLEMPGTMNIPYGFDYGEKSIREFLSDKSNSYGRCVYKSDNNVVDHQTVIMQYGSGATATLNMHAFAQSTYRHTKITGTRGEIDSVFADEGESYIQLSLFSPVDRFKTQRFSLPKGNSGHGGGDRGFIASIQDYFFHGKKSADISSLQASMASHLMAFAAERSRAEGGAPKKL